MRTPPAVIPEPPAWSTGSLSAVTGEYLYRVLDSPRATYLEFFHGSPPDGSGSARVAGPAARAAPGTLRAGALRRDGALARNGVPHPPATGGRGLAYQPVGGC